MRIAHGVDDAQRVGKFLLGLSGELRLIDRVRAARPDIALSGDFIVGFPGETEEEFADTLRRLYLNE